MGARWDGAGLRHESGGRYARAGARERVTSLLVRSLCGDESELMMCRQCRLVGQIEGARLPAASKAARFRALPTIPGGGFERRIVRLSASDEATPKKIIGESSRFVSQIRR